VDVLEVQRAGAVQALRESLEFQQSMATKGIPWGRALGILKTALAGLGADDRFISNHILPHALSEVLGGAQGEAWTTELRQTKGGTATTRFIVRRATPA
jgi:hypothetical protein